MSAAGGYGGRVNVGMGTLESIGVFGGIPLGLFLLIAVLVSAPGWAREGRYRPGLAWDAEPVWLGGPEDGEAAAAPSANVGGASIGW